MSGPFLEEFAAGFTISLVWLTIHVLSTYRRGNTSARLVSISTISSAVALYLLASVPHESISSSLKSLIHFLALTPLVATPFLLRISASHPDEFDSIALQEADSVSDSE